MPVSEVHESCACFWVEKGISALSEGGEAQDYAFPNTPFD
jgi:hypothetical protein